MSKYLVTSGQLSQDDIKEDLSYAELWVGAHTKTPNLLEDGSTLSDYVEKNSNQLGEKIVKNFGPTLPFLLKVLSIGHPLQLQVHPTKDEARELHRENPRAFLDDNHKPEMAVALTPFTALCGFRNPEEIQEIVEALPEFEKLLGEDTVQALHGSCPDPIKIRKCYEAIFQTKHDQKELLSIQKSIYKTIEKNRNVELKMSLFGDEFMTIFDSFPGKYTCSLKLAHSSVLPRDTRRPGLLRSPAAECVQTPAWPGNLCSRGRDSRLH